MWIDVEEGVGTIDDKMKSERENRGKWYRKSLNPR